MSKYTYANVQRQQSLSIRATPLSVTLQPALHMHQASERIFAPISEAG